jgi:hypothetical protein
MLHAYLDESGTHYSSDAVAVVAVVATPEAWETFTVTWTEFLAELGLQSWHHRDFDKRRNQYRVLTPKELDWARQRLCEIIGDGGFFIGGTAIARSLYKRVSAEGKWRLPRDPYNFCLERCLCQITKRIFSSRQDDGVVLLYDNRMQYGRISRDLTRWHRESFEPSYLSQYKARKISLEFLEAPPAPAQAVPDIIAFEACAYVQANTSIPFLGAKLLSGETPEPRPIIKMLTEDQRVVMAVTTYTDWYLDFDLEHASVRVEDNGPERPSAKFWR